jgi:hypothetical protein
MCGAADRAATAGWGSWVPGLVGPDGAVRSTTLLGLSVVGVGGSRAVGDGGVSWMVEGALMVSDLGSHGRVER